MWVSLNGPCGCRWAGREPKIWTGLGPIWPTTPVKAGQNYEFHKTMNFKLSSRAASPNPASAATSENIALLQCIRSRRLSIHFEIEQASPTFRPVQASGDTWQPFAVCGFSWLRPPEAWISV